MAYANSYDRLYENMKERLTVIENNAEYTLGEFMSMKAEIKKADALLPVAERSTATKSEKAVAMLISYVNDKLTVKEPPVKDKTIRAFPFRASASALLSAVVACSFIFSFGIIGAKLLGGSTATLSESMACVESVEVEQTEAELSCEAN
ncbi:MAG: hypothetical protein J6Q85_01565 [Clostridia bacterium]|nr:hypothetical protein [Clostridia bacterium]